MDPSIFSWPGSRSACSGRAFGSALCSSPMAGIAVPVSVQRKIRVHVCSVDAVCRSCQSNCNDNTHTLGNAMSHKEEVATNNDEPQVRYIHWAEIMEQMHDDTNESDEYM